MEALRVSDLHLDFATHFWRRRKPVLRGVSFSVHSGEVFGFLGPNGSGKTTTIKAALGLVRPRRGSVTVLGGSINDLDVRRRLGFLPERSYFPEHFTGRELLLQHGLLCGLDWRAARQAAAREIERVGMAHAAHEPMRGYSKGMLQRIGLAQALVGAPDLVVLDEPMSGLDPVGRRDIREIIVDLRKQGKTVFFSTHILPDVEMICDRVAILVGGVVRRVGPLHEVAAQARQPAVDVTTGPVPAPALEAVRGLARVMEPRGEGCHFEVASYDDANRLVDALRAHGVVLRGMQSQRGSLEEAFLQALVEKAEEAT